MGFSWQESLERVAISFSRRFSQPRDWTRVSHVVGRCSTVWTTREVLVYLYVCVYILFQFSSVIQSCPTLCDPMDRSMPGLSVHHQLPEFTQLMAIKTVMPSNHLILCCPILLPPLVLPSIRVFSDESVLHIRWPKYWSFSFSICPSSEYSGLFSFGWTGWISFLSKGLSRIFSNTTVKKHQFFSVQLS